jgi:hypothetical protein
MQRAPLTSSSRTTGLRTGAACREGYFRENKAKADGSTRGPLRPSVLLINKAFKIHDDLHKTLPKEKGIRGLKFLSGVADTMIQAKGRCLDTLKRSLLREHRNW